MNVSPQRHGGTEEENLLSDKVIGAAITVHRELGPGLLEAVYEECLCAELSAQGLHVQRQVPVPLRYRGKQLNTCYRLDIVVENRIVVEVKAAATLLPVHEAQLLSYLKLSGIRVGLLMNFHAPLLKQGIKRRIYDHPPQQTSVPPSLHSEKETPQRRRDTEEEKQLSDTKKTSVSPCLCGERKPTEANIVTEQLTTAGRKIEHSSFAIVDAEAGDRSRYSDAQWPLVRRMIHATADFAFNGLTEFHPDAMQAGLEAVAAGAPIVADVEMICVGLSKPRLAHFGVETHHFIADEDVIAAAKAEGTTRAVQAMRKAHRQGLLEGAIVGVGNAPTALLELIRLIDEEEARPALIIGMPVGFVSAAESKDAVAELNAVPWVITRGRKGGSTLVVSAIHAMLAQAEEAARG